MENNVPIKQFIYDGEAEKASFAYLMTTLIVIVGLPMPIINVIGSVVFYFANRKKTYFVRYHCLQSMLSQLAVVPINSIGIGWTVAVITGKTAISNLYIAYIITILGYNILEFAASIYAAVKVRKKKNVRFWFFGLLTEKICKETNNNYNSET